MVHVKWQSTFEHAQNAQIQIILCICKVHPGLCSPFMHFGISNVSVSVLWMSDQTASMLRPIWAFTVRICQKTSGQSINNLHMVIFLIIVLQKIGIGIFMGIFLLFQLMVVKNILNPDDFGSKQFKPGHCVSYQNTCTPAKTKHHQKHTFIILTPLNPPLI